MKLTEEQRLKRNKAVQAHYYKNKERLMKERKPYRKQWRKANRHKDKKYRDEHKEEQKQHYNKMYKLQPDKFKNARMKYNYGITLEQYNNWKKSQDYKCLICGKSESEVGSLVLDHDHKTGKNRGFLCSKHNLGLGNFEDNIEYLQSAINYLKAKGI